MKRSYSSELDSAYEWLAKDRFLSEPEKHVEIRWFHPNAAIADDDTCYGGNNYTEVKRMPLYPLGAVHIPHSGENYTIINIEPRNVKMAMVSNDIFFLFFRVQHTVSYLLTSWICFSLSAQNKRT